MPFDFGFNFRGSGDYVTDQAYCDSVTGETYPTTYTNGNGLSVNAGWDSINSANRSASNDARLAGINYTSGAVTRTFRVDLDSGSGPGAGDYLVDIAAGDASGAQNIMFILKDDTTALITKTNTATGGANHFFDATGTDVAASTNWTGTQVSKTFASTIARLVLNQDANGSIFVTLAHFRLTKQEAGGPVETVTLALAGMA